MFGKFKKFSFLALALLFLSPSVFAEGPFSLSDSSLKAFLEMKERQDRSRAPFFQSSPSYIIKSPKGFPVPVYFHKEVSGFFISTSHFLKIFSSEMTSITEATGWEFCGYIQKNGAVYGLKIYTSRSSLFCALPPSKGRESVHAHPPLTVAMPDKIDKDALGLTNMQQTDPETFSPEDLSSGAGWLITPSGKILHVLPPGPPHDHESFSFMNESKTVF